MKQLRATIKIFVFFAFSFGLYFIWFVGSFIIPNKPYWRQIIFRTWAKWFVQISGMEVEILGEAPSPPFFLVSNHLSYTDIPLLRSIVEGVFVAKGDIEGWFCAGKMVGNIGNVFINRGNRRDIPLAGAKILDKLNKGEGIIVFPEGTSSKGESVLPFNSSFFEFAAQTDLPIHYASITYQTNDSDPKASEAICWWDDTTFIVHIWRFFQLRKCRAIVSFGCESTVSLDRKKLARELWNRVNEKFIPMV